MIHRCCVAPARLMRLAGLMLLLIALPAAAAQRAQIEALHHTDISGELSGRIDKIGYRQGESFAKGAVLVSIDCTSYIAERDRMAAKYGSAKAKHANQEQLARLHSAGQLEVDLSKLSVSETGAQLRAARADVSRCDIRAPFAGRVASLDASLGQSIKPQEKLLSIVGDELNARIIVPANWLAWLSKGDAVHLAVSETGTAVPAHVVRIGAAVDPVSHTIPIWARLDETKSLRPGMTAAATFPDAPAAAHAATADHDPE